MKAKIGEIEIQFYKIFVEKEKLTLTVPINQRQTQADFFDKSNK